MSLRVFVSVCISAFAEAKAAAEKAAAEKVAAEAKVVVILANIKQLLKSWHHLFCMNHL